MLYILEERMDLIDRRDDGVEGLEDANARISRPKEIQTPVNPVVGAIQRGRKHQQQSTSYNIFIQAYNKKPRTTGKALPLTIRDYTHIAQHRYTHKSFRLEWRV